MKKIKNEKEKIEKNGNKKMDIEKDEIKIIKKLIK